MGNLGHRLVRDGPDLGLGFRIDVAGELQHLVPSEVVERLVARNVVLVVSVRAEYFYASATLCVLDSVYP